MGDSYYELRLDKPCVTLVCRFNADISLEELRYNLRNFLCGCSWSEDQVDEILGGEL